MQIFDSANHVAIGMVPIRTLGLPQNYALDNYGRTITYAVDTNATVCFTSYLSGQISVSDNGVPNTTIAVLVSHGSDGHGAWIPLTGSSGTAARLNARSTDTDQLTNAHKDSSFSDTTPLTNFVKKTSTSTFDDLVVYRSNLWTLNTPSFFSTALYPNLSTVPSNGNYLTGQALSFQVTFPSAVTVTGTPRLQLTVGSSTDYATYTSGTGTTILSFSYTVLSSDYAPSGISISSPINLNGGTITLNGSPACLPFSIPDLSKVLVNILYNYPGIALDNGPVIWAVDRQNNRVQGVDTSYAFQSKFGTLGSGNTNLNSPSGIAIKGTNLWIADTGNNRVVEWDNGPSYQNKFGSAGTGNGQFSSPTGIAIDSSGNIYVVDQGNNRVEKFTSGGVYTSQFGSLGTGNGQFTSPNGIAVDTSGNIYVVDTGNNRVQKFDSSGVYQSTIGSAGTGNGQFTGPIGIVLDSSSNIFVSDAGNNRVEKFNSSGVYQSAIGASGSGNGQFSYPQGLAVDTSNNLYVVDKGNERVQKFNTDLPPYNRSSF